MLALVRVVLVLTVFVFICILGFVVCLFRPFHRNAVYWFAQLLSKISKLLGLKLIFRRVDESVTESPSVIVANHQSSYDLFTIAGGTYPGVTSVGKKSLLWYPFFGMLYWLSGNILIDRKNGRKASGTIEQAAQQIRENNRTVWMFPEGTRSRGRSSGMLPFKLGAFRLAKKAGVPIVPMVASKVYDKVNANRWDNGLVIIETMAPVTLDDSKTIPEWAEFTRELMLERFQQLNEEVARLEAGERPDSEQANGANK